MNHPNEMPDAHAGERQVDLGELRDLLHLNDPVDECAELQVEFECIHFVRTDVARRKMVSIRG